MKKVYKVTCTEGHIVTVESQSEEFKTCVTSVSPCTAPVIIVSEQISI